MLIQIDRTSHTADAMTASEPRPINPRSRLGRACWGGLINLLRRRPLLAVFQVTLRCNSACGYCNLPLNQGRYELSRREIRSVFGALYAEGLRFIFVQGGEPLLRRDLAEILEDLRGIGFHCSLITNGTRLTEALVRRLDDLSVPLSISLDSLDREIYRRIRGADQLPLVLSGMDLLTNYRSPKFIVCIVSQLNRDEVLTIAQFAKGRGFVPVIGSYHWDVGHYGKQDCSLMYDPRQASLVFERLLENDALPPGYFRQYAKDNLTWLRGLPLSPCDAGRYSIAIDASGNVSPCLSLSHAGNLLRSSISDILARFDQREIDRCSNQSSCNRIDGRVIGSVLRHPIEAWRTGRSL